MKRSKQTQKTTSILFPVMGGKRRHLDSSEFVSFECPDGGCQRGIQQPLQHDEQKAKPLVLGSWSDAPLSADDKGVLLCAYDEELLIDEEQEGAAQSQQEETQQTQESERSQHVDTQQTHQSERAQQEGAQHTNQIAEAEQGNRQPRSR